MVHYFTTYKDLPTENTRKMKLTGVYGKDIACDVIRRAAKDYAEQIGDNVDDCMD